MGRKWVGAGVAGGVGWRGERGGVCAGSGRGAGGIPSRWARMIRPPRGACPPLKRLARAALPFPRFAGERGMGREWVACAGSEWVRRE